MNTPLHIACMHGHKELCQVLLCEGADEKAKNVCNFYPLLFIFFFVSFINFYQFIRNFFTIPIITFLSHYYSSKKCGKTALDTAKDFSKFEILKDLPNMVKQVRFKISV
jgi:ankyrin repeat protein